MKRPPLSALRACAAALLFACASGCAGHEREHDDASNSASSADASAAGDDASTADAKASEPDAGDAATSALDASVDAARGDAASASDAAPTNEASTSETSVPDSAQASGPLRAEWHTFHGAEDHDEVRAVALGADDSIYVIGESPKSWNGPAGQAPLAPRENTSGTFVLKLSADGAYQWHGFYGELGGWSSPPSAVVGPDGNLYVTGTSSTAWMGPSGQAPLNAYAGGRDIMLFSLRPDGGFRWHTFIGGTPQGDDSMGHEESTAISVDRSGALYVVGEAVAGFKGVGGAAPLRGASISLAGFHSECVVLKLTPDGAYVWHTFQGGSARDACHGVEVDSQGQIFLSGTSFGPWANGTQPLHRHSNTSASLDGQQEDIFVAGLNPDGRVAWHTFLGSTSMEFGGSLRIGPDGALYVATRSSGPWNGPAGEKARYDGYAGRDTNLRTQAPSDEAGAYRIGLVKLDKAGGYQWHAQFGDSPTPALLAFEHGRALLAASADVGWNGPAGQLPRLPHAPAPAEGQGYATSGMLISIDAQGVYAWHSFTGVSDGVMLSSLSVDSRGQIITAGTSSQNWSLAGRAPLHAHSGSYSDALVMKLTAP